ncbi:MAG: type II secretion system inner membrane protein GspF [Nitrospirae bacterium]|nr:type II secretion system inner membrane protein GspF [Nitrospirota bacterium]
MAVFEYTALTAEGKTVSGVIDADNVKEARLKLKRTGVFPVDVAVGAARPSAGGRRALFGERVSMAELSVLTRQLSTLLTAGLPLVDSLGALGEQVERTSVKRVVAGVRERIREGASFADALAAHPSVFSLLYVNMVRVGEASGTLDRVLLSLAEFLERQARLRNQVMAALTYPLLMLAVSVIILVFLVAFVVPKVTVVFADMHQALPWPTVVLIALSDALRLGWWVLALAGVGGGVAIARYVRTPAGRRRYDASALRLPVIGRLVRMIALSRFTSTLSTLLAGGIGLLTALEIVKNVVHNVVIADAIESARENIRQGQSIAEPLRRSGVFPPLVTHMIAVGELSGELETMLKKVSEAYDHEVETTVGALTALLSPVMILVMGGVILFIVLAILLPIFEMSQIVR